MRYLLLVVVLFSQVVAFDIEPVDDTVKKDPNKLKIAKDGKPIYSAIKVQTYKSKITTISAMQVPVIYAEGQRKPKQKVKPKPEKIDKIKYFAKKATLKKEKVSKEKILVDESVKFFETINKKDSKPVDIEK